MKLQIETGDSRYLITSYGAGEVVVNEERLTRSFVIGPDTVIRDWGPSSVHDMEARHLEAILELAPEVVLLGTGENQVFPDPAMLSAMMARGVGLEVMDTGAACRTYNILLGEGRRIVAGLMMI